MIHSLNFHGNWSKAGNRYTEVDVKLLRNEKAQNRLGEKFKNCGHDFDVHFYKGPRSNWINSLCGDRSPEWVMQSYGIDIKQNDDRITLLITSNIGSPKYPLTPWMIAHRISHSLWQNSGYVPLLRYFNQIMGEWPFLSSSKWFGCAIGTTRSCRNRTLANSTEMLHELFAQCLLTGRINLKRIENRVFTRKRWNNSEYKHFSDAQVDKINSAIDRMENMVYNSVQDLHSMYGSVVVV